MSSAIHAYTEMQRAGLSGRDLERSALLKAAARLAGAQRLLQAGQSPNDDALLHNRRLWEILLLTTTDANNPLPFETKKAMANIGIFVLGQCFDQLAKPSVEGYGKLIEINMTLAEGLISTPASEPQR